MILNQIIWDISPIIFTVGNFEIRWYGLFFALAFYLGYVFFTHVFKKEGLNEELLDKLAIYMVLGTVLGARLGHCLFYEPEYYLANPIEILKVWKGGLASHGAVVGILLSLYLFRQKHMLQRSYLWLVDRIVIPVALAAVFIRSGNLMNSEIIGAATDVPWAFVFTGVDDIARHPTQIYEALSYLLIFIGLFLTFKIKKHNVKEGSLFAWFLISIFTARFIIEFYKEVQVDFEQTMALNMGQLLSIPIVILGIALLVWVILKGHYTYPLTQKPNK